MSQIATRLIGAQESPMDVDPDDERTQELSTVPFIFPELIILNSQSATISIAVSPEIPIPVTFEDGNSAFANIRKLSHFPPIQFTIVLPEGYPAKSPPHTKLESRWAPTALLQRLEHELYGLWKSGKDYVLYDSIDHLQQSARRGFNLTGNTKGSPDVLTLPGCLEDVLVPFNKKTIKDVFNMGTYECGVCLEPKKGSACHSLYPCGHVFCTNCLKDFYSSCITEGDVSAVKCLDVSCILNKKKPKNAQAPALDVDGDNPPPKAELVPTLPPDELEDIGLAPDLVTRYLTLKRKEALDADPKTIYCPRTWCQAPSRSSLEEMDRNIGTKNFYLTEKHIEEKMAELTGRTQAIAVENSSEAPSEETTSSSPVPIYVERLDRCSACGYAFCKVCLHGWHGDYVICRREDAPPTEEELATMEYLKQNAAGCPSCGASVIKSHGCNHMICKCKTHFCFLCSAYLPPGDPYKHFNTKSNSCFMRLWEGEEGDEFDDRAPRPRDPEHEESDDEEFEDLLLM